MLEATSIIVTARDQVSCDIGGEIAILHLTSGIYYGLNSVGSRVWELIQEPRPFGELEQVLREEYEVAPERLSSDLRELLEKLASAGLVEQR
jgi:hypothetical protein